MKRMIKWAGIAAGAIVLLLALAAATGYGLLRNTVPAASGSLVIAGLSEPVEVVRDREAVPHIFAKTIDDLYVALGFVHAQDRLWQMELQRRTGQGRLSEIFAEPTFGTDVFIRTLDLYGHAERSLAALSPEARRALDAYARGVNAFLNRSTGMLEPRLPPEFLLLRHQPEPWRPADSVVVIKLMALQLSTNLNHELLRLAFAAQGLNSEEIEDLMPLEAADAPPPMPELAQLYPLQKPAAAQRRAAISADLDAAIGSGASNNWVVSGARTTSGKPLLANDPHLRLGAPAVWYLAHLALERPGAEAANAAGASLPGVPYIVLGRGDAVAWGFTNAGPDVQDLFIEKVNPNNPREYKTPEGWRPFTVEDMAIVVKGVGVRKVERRRTRHGPVLPGFYRNLEGLIGANHVAALQWTALSDDDTTIAAGMFDPTLRSVGDYIERMRQFVVPMQSMVLADATGRIGMIAPGRVPVRDPANKVAGRAPVPGWEAAYDWKGYLKFEDLPRVEAPNVGAVGTANARIVDPGYPHHLTYDWDPAFRQQRVKELIFDHDKHDLGTMRAAQADVLSLAIVKLQPLMIAAAQAGGSVDNAVLDQLTTWDATMRADRPEPLIFAAWIREAVRAIYSDDLGAAFDRYFESRAPALIRLLEGKATGRDWCDDRTTPGRESCGAMLAAALNRALGDLDARYGTDRSKWRWGAVHYAFGEHRPFGAVAGLAKYFNVEVPSPGGDYTLNRGKMDFEQERPLANRHASSYRAIYDFADLERSLYIHTTGQSGNPLSPYYRSFADRWAKVDYIEIATRREAILKAPLGTWRLSPR
ncbi:MAG: penicillin acylase family protein [Hyphomonadaceae bacterium]|jgi:penicillin amidase|nr:penicillin acylase family protein [Hyphomonadaceae bacterium]